MDGVELITILTILSDVMSLGRSSFFYQHLVKIKKICAHVDAYITGTEDEGLFIIEARPSKDVTIEQMEAEIWKELSLIQLNPVDALDPRKLKNKNESTMTFSNVSAASKATSLAYYESLGDAQLINTEADRIAGSDQRRSLTCVAQQLRKDNVNILRLKGNGSELVPAHVLEEEDEEEED
jgi:predicted Zn-dependent peptidase